MRLFKHFLMAAIIFSMVSTSSGQVLKKLKKSAPKKPKITYDRYEVKSISFEKTEVDFIYIIDNPNSFGLDHIFVDYELFVKKQSMATGKDIRFKLKAKGKSELRISTELNYVKLFKSAAVLTKTVVSGKKTVPFTIDTNFKVDLKLLKFNIPVSASGDLPLPKVKTKLF